MLDKSKLSEPLSDSSSLTPSELAKFDALATEWWDETGKMKSALAFNRARLAYIKSQICSHFTCIRDNEHDHQFTGISVLDVGCGGGLISEPLALAGAEVTGIDASAKSIEVARHHAKRNKVENICYRHALCEDIVQGGITYDVVINAEVVEHVTNQKGLIDECCQLVKPGGMLILATLNKTIKSYLIAILGAEYILRYLPIGTHDWRYFVKPETLMNWVKEQEFSYSNGTGMAFNPLTSAWRYTQSMPVNYCLCFTKVEK